MFISFVVNLSDAPQQGLLHSVASSFSCPALVTPAVAPDSFIRGQAEGPIILPPSLTSPNCPQACSHSWGSPADTGNGCGMNVPMSEWLRSSSHEKAGKWLRLGGRGLLLGPGLRWRQKKESKGRQRGDQEERWDREHMD